VTFLDDRYLVVRGASVYVAVVLTTAACVWRRPGRRAIVAAGLAFAWTVPAILALDLVAARAGWWDFDARGGLLLGMPVDLFLAWAWLWSIIPALAFPALRLTAIVLIALAFDLVAMPAASPVLRLGPYWMVGDAIGVLVALVPGQLLARWTARDEHLEARAALQVVAFSGLVAFVLPAVAIEGSGSAWSNPLDRPLWQNSLLAQLLAVPAVLGLSAVQEFVERGRGTPIPFDPPRRHVTTGIYAYVGNPMQLSAVVLLMLLGLVLRNPWVSAAGVMAHLYSLGLAGWDEDEDLRSRFGSHWIAYRQSVRRWFPRLRPWYRSDLPPARLFVSETCDMCSPVGQWFVRRGATNLTVVPAEQHPSRSLTRITYQPSDGTRAARGVEAIARALEHVHLGWALVGCFLRLPGIAQLAQLLADASGAQPRRLPIQDGVVHRDGPTAKHEAHEVHEEHEDTKTYLRELRELRGHRAWSSRP
jgi:protein-S-isoprenylcysteine O-methyltransferase Ste14